MDMSDKLQKWVRRTTDLSTAALLFNLGTSLNVGSVSLSVDIAAVDIRVNWLNCFHFLIVVGPPPGILIGCVI